jgi:hypothetical protein
MVYSRVVLRGYLDPILSILCIVWISSVLSILGFLACKTRRAREFPSVEVGFMYPRSLVGCEEFSNKADQFKYIDSLD